MTDFRYRAAIFHQGSDRREETNCMIDDDTFEKFFRKLMENFFGRSGPGQDARIFGGPDIESWDDPRMEERVDSESEGHPFVERFDFDDHVLLVIQGCQDDSAVIARAKGRLVILETGNGKELMFEMPFGVDADRSSISCRNGVAEVIVRMSETENYDDIDRVLRFE
jgi:hypothetical protein